MIEAKIITRGNCMLCGKPLSEGEGIFFCKECTGKTRDENNSVDESKMQDVVKRKAGTPREDYEPLYNCENWIP